jgi:hypothetical protein
LSFTYARVLLQVLEYDLLSRRSKILSDAAAQRGASSRAAAVRWSPCLQRSVARTHVFAAVGCVSPAATVVKQLQPLLPTIAIQPLPQPL